MMFFFLHGIYIQLTVMGEAIIWGNGDPDLRQRMASLGHDELNVIWNVYT